METAAAHPLSLQPRLAAISFGFRLRLRLGLRIADGLRQHLAQFSFGLRGFPREGFLPLCHRRYVGMLEGELNPAGTVCDGSSEKSSCFASIRSWKMPYRKFNLTIGNLLASSQQRRMRPKREPCQGLQLLKEPLKHDADQQLGDPRSEKRGPSSSLSTRRLQGTPRNREVSVSVLVCLAIQLASGTISTLSSWYGQPYRGRRMFNSLMMLAVEANGVVAQRMMKLIRGGRCLRARRARETECDEDNTECDFRGNRLHYCASSRMKREFR